jgi:rubredoxin
VTSTPPQNGVVFDTAFHSDTQIAGKRESMEKYECLICGFTYDEFIGHAASGDAAGTQWGALPDDWVCPDCGVGKADFENVVD